MSGNLEYSHDSLPHTFSGNVPFDHFSIRYYSEITNTIMAVITPLNKRNILEFLRLQMPCGLTYISCILCFLTLQVLRFGSVVAF